MINNSINTINTNQEVNLKSFFRKIYKYRLLYLFSILSFVALTLLYLYITIPTYKISTSILIDPSGSNRVLGESKYIEGGVGLIEMEKNLYNEIGIIKSFNLIKQTVDDLDFDLSYHSDTGFKTKEHYGYFPFEVVLSPTNAQLFDVPFNVKILSENKFQLSVVADEFIVSNPTNNSMNEITRDFRFLKNFSFGETVEHDYFNFTINKPDYKVNKADFEDQQLSFVIHNEDAVAQAYMNKIEVSNIDIQASIFNIVSIGEVVQKEVDFLDRLTHNYIQNKLTSRNKIATTKEEFIRDQLGIATDSLFRFESDLETFKKNEGAVNLGKSATNALESTRNLQAARAKINLEIQYFTSLINDIETNRKRDDFVIPTSMSINNTVINENIIALNRLYAERTQKKYYVTENNEEMNILSGQINASTEKLLGNLRNAIRSSEIEAQNISARLSNFDQEISSLPTREKQLLSIERQSALYENLFNYLSQELAKTGIARAESTIDTRVLDEARQVGGGPIAPKKLLLLALAVILGTTVPTVWTMLFTSNDTIEYVNQIVANSQIPVVGKIVNYDKKSVGKKRSLSLWKVKESFRDLSANLQFHKSNSPCIIGITSIMPKEGKTFCSINLGLTFAERGQKTLIIDTDLRHPSLVKVNDRIKGKGLDNYLQGDASMEEIFHIHNKLNNLHFIPTSICDRNVHELLTSNRMKLLIEKSKETYDYIILDTPAVGLVSDFLLFSEVITINLFVVRRSIAKLAFLEDLRKLLPENNKTKSTIVFNGTLDKDYKYGYAQRYGVNKENPIIDEFLPV